MQVTTTPWYISDPWTPTEAKTSWGHKPHLKVKVEHLLGFIKKFYLLGEGGDVDCLTPPIIQKWVELLRLEIIF